MAKKKIKVLYFLAGARPTEDDDAAIAKYTPKHQICFRNAKFVGDNDAVEDFDIVAGAVPSQYAKVAELKGPPVEAERPKTKTPETPAEKPKEGATDAKDDGKPADAAKDGEAKPKAPEGKPEAAKGWKPNA